MSEADRHIESVLSALSLLECFERDEALRLEDFHARTGLTRSRIMRMAGTLAHMGYLVHDRGSARYQLGPTLFRFGAVLADRYGSLATKVRPALKELTKETGLTAMFSVLGGRDRLILAKEETDEPVRYTVCEGQKRPVALGASGRVLLAFSNEKTAADLIAKSKLDTTEKEHLLADLDGIRTRSFDVSESELTRNAFAIARPVCTGAGDLLGVITIAGPTMDYDEAALDGLLELLRVKAEQIASEHSPVSAESEQTK